MQFNRKLKNTFWNYSLQELAILLRRKFSHTSLAEFNDKKPCVFVLSTGRVGSETIKKLLALSNNVTVFHEPRPELFSLSKTAYQLQNDYQQSPSIKEALLEGFWVGRRDLFRFVRGSNRGYVETGPDITFLAEILAEALPYTRFIHLVRDPCDVIYSAMRRKWFAGHNYDDYRIHPLPGTKYADQWEHFSAFEKNVWLWAETNRWIHSLFNRLPLDRTLFIHSEDVFNEDPQTLQKLYHFIDPGFYPPSRKIKNVLGMKSNAQKIGEYSKVTKWTPEQKDFLVQIAGNIAFDLGYDLHNIHLSSSG